MNLPSPSGGAVWPVTLRRKLGLPPSANNASSASKKSDDEEVGNHSHHKLSTHQLRNYIHSSYAALTSIQRQLHRGEESYFEETYAHGNLFSGWDNIWIENPNSGSHGINATLDGGSTNASLSSSGGVNHNNNSSNPPVVKHISTRKMPNDFRWFSSSSCSVLATGEGKIAELGRPSLMDRPPTPEIKEDETKKKSVTSSNDKPTVCADTATDTAAEEQLTEKMDVDVVNDDSNTKSQVRQEQTEDIAAPPTKDDDSTKEEKQVPSQEEKMIKVEEDVKNEQSSSSVDPDAEAKDSNAEVAVSAVPPPSDQPAQPIKTESKNDGDVSNEEQKDETTEAAEKDSNDKEEQPATDEVEDDDVEMTTEVEPNEPISNPPEPPTKETTEGLTEEPIKKEQSLSQSTTDESQQPAKVPKLSVDDTPNRAAKLATENSAIKEDTNAKPVVEKPAIVEKAEEDTATEKEDDIDTEAKTETKAARPARRATRRTTRMRKAS
mmetsp:Transcript_15367/g.25312  ORF Transcript_15367/g.25312 Transcript_15367/m.25312 type:complete len:493 (+) Transcript_15367:38-1516(+)